MAEVRTRNIVEYKKNITTDDPDAYAEAVLKFEGLEEKGTEELRQLFNKFYAEVEAIAHKETSIAADPKKQNQPQGKKVMKYKNGRPYFKRIKVKKPLAERFFRYKKIRFLYNHFFGMRWHFSPGCDIPNTRPHRPGKSGLLSGFRGWVMCSGINAIC